MKEPDQSPPLVYSSINNLLMFVDSGSGLYIYDTRNLYNLTLIYTNPSWKPNSTSHIFVSNSQAIKLSNDESYAILQLASSIIKFELSAFTQIDNVAGFTP